jgi:anti-sigma B factor antagonist
MSDLKIGKKLLGDGITMLALEGDLDMHTAPSLDGTIERLMKAGCARIVLDLRKLKYISSHGIGVLLGALSQAHEQQGNIVLMKPTPMVREVLEMLDATQLFAVVEDQPAAIASF